MSKFMKSLLSMLLAAIMVASLAVIPSSAATPKLSKSSVTLTKGYATTLSVSNASGTVKWSTGNKSVATVSSKGKVSGKGPGTTYIYAKVSGKTLKCKVTVVASKITASKSSVVLDKKGDSATITLTVKGSHGIAMTSDDKSVARGSFTTSSFSGNNIKVKITAYGAGDATIKVYNKNYPSCYKDIYVTVNEEEPENNFIMPATTSVSINAGDTYTLKVGAQNQNNLAFTVSNSNIASVTAGTASGNYRNYTIKGVAAGTATVRFYDKNNSKNYVDVTITVANDIKYYEFYTTSPVNNKLAYTDVVKEIPTSTGKYYMLVPANYDPAYVNTLIAKKLNTYDYYIVYTEAPVRKAYTDTYKSFYHTSSKYNYGARYILIPGTVDQVKYDTAVANYNGKYEYYTVYNETPVKQDTWDNVESWNVIESATGKYITRYMLVPYNVDRSKADEIKQKDQNANQVYTRFTVYTTQPTVNRNIDEVIWFQKNGTWKFMVVPKAATTSDYIKANDIIHNDTGIYEYNVLYSTSPTANEAIGEKVAQGRIGNSYVYVLYIPNTATPDTNADANAINAAMNNYADGSK